MGKDPIVANHAFKHGLSKEDILHAWRNAYAGQQRVDGYAFQTFLVGPDRKGRNLQLLERWDDNMRVWVIYHAMPLTEGGKRELGI